MLFNDATSDCIAYNEIGIRQWCKQVPHRPRGTKDKLVRETLHVKNSKVFGDFFGLDFGLLTEGSILHPYAIWK